MTSCIYIWKILHTISGLNMVLNNNNWRRHAIQEDAYSGINDFGSFFVENQADLYFTCTVRRMGSLWRTNSSTTLALFSVSLEPQAQIEKVENWAWLIIVCIINYKTVFYDGILVILGSFSPYIWISSESLLKWRHGKFTKRWIKAQTYTIICKF